MEVQNSVAESQTSDRIQQIDAINAADGESKSKVVGAPADGGEVKVDVGGVGGGVEVVKRKRGRPPRVQANVPVAKKIKEEDEDVCFICFDGGSLVLCDRRGCPKAYHPTCIKRDDAFFRSKAKWNCGWHICSICQKAAHHMCYTCTYSLCKGCIRSSDYVCVRGDKGFCTMCMRTIMLIENSGQTKDGTAVDFDDKTSWEYLFKVYWVYLKGKLSLTVDELTRAKNPFKGCSTIASVSPSPGVCNGSSDPKTNKFEISVENLEANESKRRKTDGQIQTETVNSEKARTDESSVVGPKEWATKELLDFVAHMKNGDTSVLSQFDVQALMLEYIKRNNLRDPRKKSQIICDARLKNLFGKPRVGHFEMLKLLEFHFFTKDDSLKNPSNSNLRQDDADWNSDNLLMVGKEKKRRNRKKVEERATQNKLDEYAAIDVHNMNLIYLRRGLMENLIEDGEKFHGKVVGSIVRIRISGSDPKNDMYRLVQVVGTSKVDVPYKIGTKSVDIMLEVLNLDKKETVSIDAISNQEFLEDECRRLRQSIRCGLVRRFTVGEIQEKAVALQAVRLNDVMEAEILRLNHLRDRASEKGHKKGLREFVEKLQLLKTPEERERRLREIPEVHSDPKMNPGYESDDAEEYFNKEYEEHVRPKFSGFGGKNTSSPQKRPEASNDAASRSCKNELTRNVSITSHSDVEEGSIKATGRLTVGQPQNEIDCNGSTVTNWNHQATVSSSLSNIALETTASSFSMRNTPSSYGENDKVWHYRDPNGNIQGPFSVIQLQKWSTTGYFPVDMRIWASGEVDSLLLNEVLREQFHNSDVRCGENTTLPDKFANRMEGYTVSSAIPASTIPAAFSAPSNSHGSLGQSSGQNWSANNNLNCNPLGVASLTKSSESTRQFDIASMPSPTPQGNNAEIKQPFSSVFTVADAALVDLPSPTPKKRSKEDEKVHDARDKQQPVPPSKLLVQDSGNPPSWSSASSLVVGGAQLRETPDEWGQYSPTPVKREEWDSGRVPVPSLKPLEVVGDHVATRTSNIEQIIHSSPLPSSQLPCNNVPSWHGVGETIEFSTLAEESVSDLLAEVDAMESQNGLPSPTSRRNSFVEDLFNGSIDDFSPTPDQGTRSDGFSSSGDMQLPCQSTNTTTDEQLVGASQGNNGNVFDLTKTSAGLQQQSSFSPEMDGETKSTDAVGIPQRTNSENMAFKWAEAEREPISTDIQVNRHTSRFRPPQVMIDINNSVMAEGNEGERETETGGVAPLGVNPDHEFEVEKVKDEKHIQPVAPFDGSPDHNGRTGSDKVERREIGGETKSSPAVQDEKEEEGEYIQPTATPPKPISPEAAKVALTPGSESTTDPGRAGDRNAHLEKLSGGVVVEEEEDGEFQPPPPPPGDPRKERSETTQLNVKNSGRPEQGVANAGRSNTNWSGHGGNVVWDPQQRRYGGERHSNNSPRDRGYQVEDSGYSRGRQSSWSRQSSFGNGGASGGGYSRPQPKGQRVCKFYESGRCKKGSSCHYLHP